MSKGYCFCCTGLVGPLPEMKGNRLVTLSTLNTSLRCEGLSCPDKSEFIKISSTSYVDVNLFSKLFVTSKMGEVYCSNLEPKQVCSHSHAELIHKETLHIVALLQPRMDH